MNDERFCEFVEIITNVDLEEPSHGQETPALHAAFDENRKTLGQLRSNFRDAFPEWHFPDGQFVGNYKRDWGVGDPRTIKGGLHCVVREAWELASTGNTGRAGYLFQGLSDHFTRRAKSARGRKKEVLTLMVEALEWLRSKVKCLKVCENPQCSKLSKYFFRVYNNDRYCCRGCGLKAKAQRQAKRDAELKKPPKAPNFTDKHRKNMAIAAEKRWARVRASKGKKKYETS